MSQDKDNITGVSLSRAEKRARVAQLLRERQNSRPIQQGNLQTVVVTPHEQRGQLFPLTDIQQAYWLGRSDMFELGNVSTHLYVEIDCVQLDIPRLNFALQKVVRHHDMLRAIIETPGQQRILDQTPPYSIAVTDLREISPAERTTQLQIRQHSLSHQVLPADQWPLFEICASLLSNTDTRLHISIDLLFLDGASLMLFFKDWVRVYRDASAILTPSSFSFRDYVLALDQIRHTELYKRSLAYWRKNVHTLASAPDLPLKQAPAAITHPRFLHKSMRLSAHDWQQLQARSTAQGLTPSTVLLAVYAEIVARWSKNPQFVINVTLFNRHPFHPQVNEICGDFTSNILLNIDYSTAHDFSNRVARIQKQLWTDLEHRYISGVQVLRELTQSKRENSGIRMPVVFTSFLNLSQQGFHSLFTSWRELGNVVYHIFQTPQVWLDYQVHEDGEELILTWDVVEGIFPDGLIDDMFSTHHDILVQLARHDEYWHKTILPLLPLYQSEQRMSINATDTLPSTKLLHTLFIDHVRQYPDQIAMIADDQILTYKELYRQAHLIGIKLRALGAKPNSLIAIMMEKGGQQIVATLSVLMAGAAYLPIDPTLPQERREYLLEHAEVAIVLTQSRVVEEVGLSENYVHFYLDHAEGMGDEPMWLDALQTTTDLAYVIYTSGSTGVPKGVMIDHQGAVNTILDINQRFDVQPGDRVLALSSLSFDLSVYDIFGTLAAGATIVIPSAKATKDPAYWAELVIQKQVTIWNSVPALLEMLVDYVAGTGAILSPSIRLALLSGDWIPLSLSDRVWKLCPPITLISLGGATEASIWSIFYPIQHIAADWKSIPYGQPLLNQRVHVLNHALEPCPTGVPGQIYIGGIGLAQGYWRDEVKTQASFFFHPRTGERLYRTGDLGCYMPDGNIEFLGREDFQVKIQGYRIELGEIEAVLEHHPQVQAAIVAAVGEAQENKHLVAYIVPQQEQPLSTQTNSRASEDFYDTLQSEEVLHDPEERIRFKLNQPGLRQDSANYTNIYYLHRADQEDSTHFTARSSSRSFLASPIGFEQWSRFLYSLHQIVLNGMPKYRYASAGSLYPVQTYLYIKPDCISNIEGGYYYYHPGEHSLWLLSDATEMDCSIHAPHNRALFEEAAFSIFLIGQLGAIKPIYGELARDFCLLEAGYMSQLLMSVSQASGIGLCPIGTLDFARIQHFFALKDDSIFLHAFLGGRLDQSSKPTMLASIEKTLQRESSKQPTLTTDELSTFLHAKLPGYMVPSVFMFLDALPLTANGKVDRRSLPLPNLSATPHEHTFVPARTSLEQRLAHIWATVFELDQVSMDDNFFALGGNSLLALKVTLQIRDTLQVSISLRDIFEYPTIAKLAAFLEPQIEYDAFSPNLSGYPPHTATEERIALETESNEHSQGSTSFPLSFAQQRLWFLEQMLADQFPYNIPTVLRLHGPIRREYLEQSLQAVIQRHESLRTGIELVDHKPVQVVKSLFVLPIVIVNLMPYPTADREAQAQRIILQDVQRRFVLAHEPLIRIQLLQLKDDVHLLAITVHHTIADGWSMGLFCRELVAHYKALLDGTSVQVPALPIQYTDYTLWEREHLSQELKEKCISYWQEQLKGVPFVLDLLTDRPRPAIQTYPGAQCTLYLTQPLTMKLMHLSQQENATLFMTLLAAFQVLLYRYSGQETLLVGCPVANRELMQIQNLIGNFANTLVLRGDLTDKLTFRQFLLQVRKTVLDAYAQQELPFEHLVETLQPKRDLSHNPLFQAMFLLQDETLPATHIGDLCLESIQFDSGFAQFDLKLTVVKKENSLWAYLDYNTDLFEASTIQRMLEHLQTLLAGVVEDPEQRIVDLPLLTRTEHQRLLREWNTTSTAYPPVRCIHELVEEQVARTPEAIAVVYAEQALTYAALNQRAIHLAQYLVRKGVGPEVPVGLCIERSLELVVGMLAILKAGGAYVPLDPELPPERLAMMLTEAHISLVVTMQHTRQGLSTLPASGQLCLDTDWVSIAATEFVPLPAQMNPEHLIYVIYTSGSTGKPKGVMNIHRGLYNRLMWMQEAFRLTGSDRVLQKTPISFDVSFWEFFWPLCQGASLVLAEPGGHQDSRYLVDILSREAITTVHFVPAMLRVFLQEPAVESCRSLRQVICSGEALSNELQQAFLARLTVPLYNLYGPTEAAIDVTWWKCEPDWPATRPVPIGHPIANTEIYLLDKYLQLVPIGVVGELYIGGVGLARGYVQQAEMTAERFVPHSWSTQPGQRLYKTGDRARYRENGSIEFLGRVDTQVKLRGLRIELGEIETILRQHPMLHDAVTMIREDQPGNIRLVAYSTVTGSNIPTIQNMRQFLLTWLPEYMVPSAFVFLQTMPLTPNGKIDRTALPVPSDERPSLKDEFVIPQTEAEQSIAAIWQDVLHIQQVGTHDNFFDLGGHSLLAFEVLNRLATQWQRDLSITDIFKYTTIKTLAGYLTQGGDKDYFNVNTIERAKMQKEAIERRKILAKERKSNH